MQRESPQFGKKEEELAPTANDPKLGLPESATGVETPPSVAWGELGTVEEMRKAALWANRTITRLAPTTPSSSWRRRGDTWRPPPR